MNTRLWTKAQQLTARQIIENETPQTAYEAGGMSFYNAYLCLFGRCLRKRLNELVKRYGESKSVHWELSWRSTHKWTPHGLRRAMAELIQY